MEKSTLVERMSSAPFGHCGPELGGRMHGWRRAGFSAMDGGCKNPGEDNRALRSPGCIGVVASHPTVEASYTADALCPSHLIGIMVARKRNPKLAYVRREGTAKQRAFPVVIRSRKLNAFKGIPPLARSWIPRWGDRHGGGTVRFLSGR